MATKLTKLRMRELSGVDDPANELPGWIVAKSAQFRDDVDSFEKDVVELAEGLEGPAADIYFDDAPDEVIKARELLAAHLAEGLEDVESEAPEVADDPERKGLVEKLRGIFTAEENEKPEAEEVEEVAKAEEEESEDEDAEEADQPTAESSSDEAPAPEVDEDLKPEIAEKAVEPEAIIKAARDGISEDFEDLLEPIREAVIGIADRVEGLEKAAAARAGLAGQEAELLASDDGRSGVAKAIQATLRSGKVELT